MVSDISRGKMTAAKIQTILYSLPIVGLTHRKQQLILLAKAGLKEEIRDGLETEEFATLEAPLEDAGSRRGLKETPPSSPGKRRRQAPITAVANVDFARRKR
ncbi:hypothetical protein Bca52824_051246 [Brassica carinata]|uniref:Uncharacterized protein n=1 Tax=Brassica carinata TaxID=52824 RepID=A0A8X7UL74_BRACI|nr:hypothetical protein Bca52824_051246 [Brassica carinata]